MEAIGKIIVKIAGTARHLQGWQPVEQARICARDRRGYPKKIFFSFFGDKANQYPLEVGQQVKVSFDIDSHEYNGRWFTNINAWKAEPYEPSAAPAPAPAPGAPVAAPAPAAPAPGAPVDFGGGSSDDLPF